MFVLAHLSDPHLPMPHPRLRELVGKRALGFLNWHRRRRFQHRVEVLDQIVTDVKKFKPDHIVVTGDLVNIALPAEFAPALALLAQLGPPERVTLVPGNHDVYVRATMWHSSRHWGAYMRGDDSDPLRAPHVGFPFLRKRGPIALIGLSTALPTAPFFATGNLGNDQLVRLGSLLEQLGGDGAFRIVMLHHPPVSSNSGWSKRLTDAPQFGAVLRQHGAELVLHGHNHERSLTWLDGPSGPIPVIGIASASAPIGPDHEPAAYNLYRIGDDIGGWRCEMIARGMTADLREVVELGRQMVRG